jgi:diguanylate cyclase (GGDEF)-like protein
VLLLLLVILQLSTAVFVLGVTESDSRQQQMQGLKVGVNVFSEILASRSLQLKQSLSLLSADFGFKQAVATKEQDTISSVLANHGKRINANAAILLSPQGELLSSSLPGLTTDEIINLFSQYNRDQDEFAVLNADHASYQFVFQPVKAPTIIAWVGMGFLLDKKVAQQAKSLTGIDVSFISTTDNHTEIVSTLASDIVQSLYDSPINLVRATVNAEPHYPDGYLSQAVKLDPLSVNQWAILHQSEQRWQDNYQQLRNSMLLIFLFTLVLVFLFAMWVTNGLSKPIDALVNFAKKVGQGQNPTKIEGAPAELQTLADTLSEMRSNIEQREQDLVYQSEHDSLTGLYNRFAAEKYLQSQIVDHQGTLLIVDIKKFRQVNDIVGVANADLLLVEFSQRLQQLTTETALLARLDGDAFILLLTSALNEADIAFQLHGLSMPFDVEGSKISLTITVGVVQLNGFYQHTDTLLRHAEIALNYASLQGDAIRVYQEGDDEKYQRELTIVKDLPQAIEQHQLHLVYQPKVDIKSNRCHAAEALIRWQHPKLGFIPPDEFIELAENSGNISIISEWVISQAVEQTRVWYQQGLDIKIAINLSAHDLMDNTLPDRISSQMERCQLPIHKLALEVTEGAMMTDTEASIAVLNQFKAKGFHISIDDFGTGHSSLAYLKFLPVSEVKIDRSFIKDIHTSATDKMIVDTSIKLIKGLGLSVVAEGVESKEGIDILRNLDCDIVQGYVYSKPLKADEFLLWLTHFNQ